MRDKLITIEVTENEFFNFQQFKKSVDRAVVVFKMSCSDRHDKEQIAILNETEALTKIRQEIEEKERERSEYINRLYIDLDERKAEIKNLKHQITLLRDCQGANLEVKEEKKPWFSISIGR